MVNEQSTVPKLNRLRVWNIIAGVILAAQAALIAELANNFSLPAATTFMSGLPGTDPELYRTIPGNAHSR